ncbi:MAG TPA: septal ring lytic transglycosylase RlpA family protein [Solirubrobacterales bacterium]|nr:septal ring lytic transglycosylase RlpA family protein [Solirubrobacterales bacterium]
MRYLLPAVVAAALTCAASTSLAAQPQHHHRRARVASHVSLHVSRHSAISGGRGVVLGGRVWPAGRHRVKLVLRGSGGGVLKVRTRPNGAFAVRWSPSRPGAIRIRAFGIHDRAVRGSASVSRRLTAYRQAEASYYGPGLYGNGVACGGTLEPGTLGVASKTLPCGAKVTLRYHGRSVTVPVIDRGPYVAGRDFDLTEATKQRLGFPGVDVLLASR